jgi:hypothetical protein
MAGVVVFIEAASNDGGNPGATTSKVFDGSTVTGWVSSASVATNTDNFLTGTSSISDKVSNATQTGYGLGAGVVGEPWNFSSGGGDEGNHIFMIINASGTRDTQANGGYGIIAADDLATDSFGTWYVGPQAGSLGGWEYFVIDPAADFDAVTAGTASWTLTGNPAQLSGVDGIGVRWKITNTVMGASDNAFVQSGSIGVGYRITGTDAVFSEISTYENTNRFGALETKSGTLFPLCKIRIGQASAAAGNVTFDDSGFNITWQGQVLSDGTSKATATGFYGLFADQGTGTTDITLDSGSLSAASPETFDLALDGVNSVTITNLAVDRARLVTLDSAVDWRGGTVKNSGQIDATDSIFLNIDVLTSTVAADTGALLWNSASDPDGNLDGCTFSKGTNAHHAIDFGTSVSSEITLRNMTFNGFGTTEDGDDAALRFLNTTGGFNVNLIGCTVDGAAATASNLFKDDAAAASAVNLIFDPVTTLVNVKDNNGVNLQSATVYFRAADGTGDLPFEESVTISRSGTLATVTHTAHGLNTNEYVKISGITDKTEDNNGAHQITFVSANSYTYVTTDIGSTSYTGTIISTGVLLYGTTDASGNISSSRTLALDQPMTGNVRKSTVSPRFKDFPIAGTIDNVTGLTINVRMILDE